MKRHFCQLLLLAATTMAAPVAFSETSIVKCVDDEGRVTLTDRPCDVGAMTVQMAAEPASDGVTRVQAHPLVVKPSVLPPPRAMLRLHVPAPLAAAKPLASDVATLKAARAQFVLSDVRSTPALAGLD